MPAAIDPLIKKQVINQWLGGNCRDKIAANNDIGAGTVSNIINEWKKGVEDSDYDSLRELTVPLKKKEIGLNELAPFVRLYNYIKKLARVQCLDLIDPKPQEVEKKSGYWYRLAWMIGVDMNRHLCVLMMSLTILGAKLKGRQIHGLQCLIDASQEKLGC